jgi:hypothetical protein
MIFIWLDTSRYVLSLFQSQPELANYKGGTTNKHGHIWSLYFVNFNLI